VNPTDDSTIPLNNRLLAALPRDEYERLLPRLELVRFPRNRVIYEAGDAMSYAYFVSSGIASLLAITENGQTIDISMIGNEGFVGIPIILHSRTPCRIMIHMPCEAMRIEAKPLLLEFHRGGQMQKLRLRYAGALYEQSVQSAVSHSLHSIKQRLCRYLMVVSDSLRSDSFELTQEDIALMLGHERNRLTLNAGELKSKGLIEYGRGRIRIIDREGLEAAACECYRIVKDSIAGMF